MYYNTKSIPMSEQANYLETHAHCLAVDISGPNIEKYFILDTLVPNKETNELVINSTGFRVFYKDFGKECKPVQIIRYTPDEIQFMVNCIGLRFGD